jgi:tetratricopeptide (TPR) repeat protein
MASFTNALCNAAGVFSAARHLLSKSVPVLAVLLVIMIASIAGCDKPTSLSTTIAPAAEAASGDNYNTVAADPRRDTQKAIDLNSQAAKLLEADKPAPAEKKLKEALLADDFCGPAHNNLGTAYFMQKKYYLAAWEYQCAAKLMPTRAEPHNNLGLVYEAACKLDDAAKAYEEAYKLEADNVDVICNLARLYVRLNHHENDEKLHHLLTEIVMRDSRSDWLAWAKEKLATMGSGGYPTTQP